MKTVHVNTFSIDALLDAAAQHPLAVLFAFVCVALFVTYPRTN